MTRAFLGLSLNCSYCTPLTSDPVCFTSVIRVEESCTKSSMCFTLGTTLFALDWLAFRRFDSFTYSAGQGRAFRYQARYLSILM
ncbi:hypothetical protein DFJ43DRAFT_1061407 [Lentinula guzmanii]|uniref:Uncharacterized protein n=1 Tax=Lentinula guzmanii TaxID=2804957 RepID=A0AA38N272_9AGAR|nr:hypothetical protein DFJ43DRAFT_1061407 [Lentinula guzmanii]